MKKEILLSFLFFTVLMLLDKVKAQRPHNEPFLVIRGAKYSLSEIVTSASPLNLVSILNANGKRIQVTDGNGDIYFESKVRPVLDFRVGGALGTHTVFSVNTDGKKIKLFNFTVNATTNIDDGGYYKGMFDLYYKGMDIDKDKGLSWNGKFYHYFEPWVLDHSQNMMGEKYFKPYGAEMVDLMRQTQRENGMIYSFVHDEPNADYFLTRDKISGYSKLIGDRVFTRQPTENHPEYLYVNSIYQCWQADANDVWMKNNLSSAAKALDYALHDPARWSKRFGLLKRVYTIDSWDFAVEDEYMPDLGITNSMMIDPEKSKFGIFFGDNTGYISSCYELAEMFEHVGKTQEAAIYKTRGDELTKRLNDLSWNGKYFTHFIDEDSTVIRHLGVDEKTQVAQGNAYSLNRDIRADQRKAIIETYLNLKNHLPAGSPGEWYAIYPPFQKGFTKHDAVWQYMNGGVGGHVAGELARGAYANGYEKYGTDILNRLFELGKKYDGKIYFSYTGSIPPKPAAPHFQSLDLNAFANMDNRISAQKGSISWMNSTRAGDDFGDLPTGEQVLSGIPYQLIDAEKNNHRSVIAVSRSDGLPQRIDIPVHKTAACIYLLHTSGKPASENVAGAVIFQYEDGSSKTNYIIDGKHLVYWWFSSLKTDYSGIAWYGKNKVSEGIGLSWCAINNPEPDKKIAKVIFEAPEGNSVYAVFAITLSDQQHYVPVNPVSFGGPDNWAAATAMAAMAEGLAGIKNKPGTQAFSDPVISPRWVTTGSDSVNVMIRYAASKGYTAYRFVHKADKKQIYLLATGSGKYLNYHILMPDSISNVKRVLANNKIIPHRIVRIENSWYVDFTTPGGGSEEIIISY